MRRKDYKGIQRICSESMVIQGTQTTLCSCFPSHLSLTFQSQRFSLFFTNCLNGVVISEKSLSGNIWLMIWLRVGRTTSRGRTRGNLQGPTTSSFVSTTSSLLASWSVTFDYITIMVRMMANVGRMTGAGSKDVGSQKSRRNDLK